MAKLSDITVHAMHETANGINYHASYPCNVFADGTFEVPIPDEEIDSFKAALEAMDEPQVKLTYSHRKNKSVLQSAQRSLIEAVCRKHAQNKVESEQTEELRIFYDTITNCAYCRDKDTGELFVNGYQCGPNYQWADITKADTSGGHVSMFSVGVAARVFKVLTITAPDGGKHIRYVRADLPEDSQGARLNTFNVHMWPRDGMKSIPYTEEAAAMFADTLWAMCRLSEGIHQFFQREPEALLTAVNKGQRLLPKG